VLRIEIAGRWSAKDFAEFYDSIDALYSLFAVVSVEEESAREFERFYRDFIEYYPGPKMPRRYRYFLGMQRGLGGVGHTPIDASKFRDAAALLDADERLTVRRCEYASPGATDFTGIGQALGHVKDVVLKCIDILVNRRERHLKNSILEEDLDAAALRNVRERLSILKELGYSDTHCRQILAEVSPAVAKLEALAQRGLITNAVSTENDG
jgi:hypothetical protein